jgi:hypothetical protein
MLLDLEFARECTDGETRHNECDNEVCIDDCNRWWIVNLDESNISLDGD